MPRVRGGRFGGLRAALERLDRLPPRRALLLGAGVGVGGGGLLWTPGGAVGLAGAALLLCGGAALLATAEPLADVAVAPEDPLPMEELPGGSFLMGSDEYEDEQPVHEVTLAPFAISRCLVTATLSRGLGEDPPPEGEGEGAPVNEGLPANNVSWYDAVAFCNRLSLRARRTPCYQIVPAPDGGAPQVTWDRSADGYRLPTEAEWEYAARGGTTSRFFFGDDEAALGRYAWFRGNSEGHPHPVGEKEPNPFGLYDMAGNLWEWCWDVYGPYRAGPQADPALQEEAAPGGGGARAREDGAEEEAGEGVDKGGDSPPRRVALRVLRGGSFVDEPRFLRSAFRFRIEPEVRDGYVGFRCVRGSRRQD